MLFFSRVWIKCVRQDKMTAFANGVWWLWRAPYSGATKRITFSQRGISVWTYFSEMFPDSESNNLNPPVAKTQTFTSRVVSGSLQGFHCSLFIAAAAVSLITAPNLIQKIGPISHLDTQTLGGKKEALILLQLPALAVKWSQYISCCSCSEPANFELWSWRGNALYLTNYVTERRGGKRKRVRWVLNSVKVKHTDTHILSVRRCSLCYS